MKYLAGIHTTLTLQRLGVILWLEIWSTFLVAPLTIISQHLYWMRFTDILEGSQYHWPILRPLHHYCIHIVTITTNCVPVMVEWGRWHYTLWLTRHVTLLCRFDISMVLSRRLPPHWCLAMNLRMQVTFISQTCTHMQTPICINLSSKIGVILPSWVGATFSRKLPLQL